jgi:DNA-binding LacI/PurR family transcriptional regulator
MSTKLLHPKAPKYLHLAEHLRGKIRKGALKSGDQLPSLAQLNAEFGASQATVERAHSLLESEGLILRAQGRGVFVAEPSRKAPRGVIGCMLPPPEISSRFPYYAHLMDGIRAAARREDAEVLLLNDLPSPGWEKVDGALLFGESQRNIPQRLPIEMPLVSLMVKLPGHASVVADDYSGARQATEYLLALGHRRIAYLTDALHVPAHTPISVERLRGYRDALRAAKIEPCDEWLIPLYIQDAEFLERGRDSLRLWWKSGGRKAKYTALFAHNDRAAIGAMEVIRENGLSIPGDISVVGFDSTNECEVCMPRLTSVAVPLREVGARATKMLLQLVREEKPEVKEAVLPVMLQVRDSTAPLKRHRK